MDTLAASLRASRVPAFRVMEVMKAAHERERAGGNVLHMEVGQPSVGAPPRVLDAVKDSLDACARARPRSDTPSPTARTRWYVHDHLSLPRPPPDPSPTRWRVPSLSLAAAVDSLGTRDINPPLSLPSPFLPSISALSHRPPLR